MSRTTPIHAPEDLKNIKDPLEHKRKLADFIIETIKDFTSKCKEQDATGKLVLEISDSESEFLKEILEFYLRHGPSSLIDTLDKNLNSSSVEAHNQVLNEYLKKEKLFKISPKPQPGYIDHVSFQAYERTCDTLQHVEHMFATIERNNGDKRCWDCEYEEFDSIHRVNRRHPDQIEAWELKE